MLLAGVGCLTFTMAGHVAAQNTFEGVIAFQTIGEDSKPDTMIQTTKGNTIKMEGWGKGNGAIVFDPAKHRMLMIQPEEKQYVLATEEDMQQMNAMTQAAMQRFAKKGASPDEDEEDPQIKFGPTGRTETVAGVKCEVWHGTSVRNGEKHEGEACLADGVGFAGFNVLSNPMLAPRGKGAAFIEQYRKLVGPNKGVIKMVEFKDGKPHSSMEAIKIQRLPIAESAFEPPAGFKEVNMHEQVVKMQQAMQKAGQK
ncbi:MAG TPA: DUF4412 domain-containing protein [Gemmatimonadales bacterium]